MTVSLNLSSLGSTLEWAVPPSPPSASLQAFLRGIERRAFVLLLTQCGEADAAASALRAALDAFVAEADALPLAQWPMRFWAIVVRQPAMLQSHRVEPALAGLSPGPRSALLLRLVAGLDFEHAAQALGAGEAAYRIALDRAVARLAEQKVDLDGLREQLQQRVKHLTERQGKDIAALRQQAIEIAPAASVDASVDDDDPESRGAQSRWRRVAIVLLVVLLLAFAASFVWPLSPRLQAGQTEALPQESGPGSPAVDDAALVTDPDYALLAQSPDDRALAQQLAFRSWWAGRDTAVASDVAAALPDAPEASEASEAQP